MVENLKQYVRGCKNGSMQLPKTFMENLKNQETPTVKLIHNEEENTLTVEEVK